MNLANKLRVCLLIVGDAIALYLGLFCTLLIRYGEEYYQQFADNHFLPFTIIFVLWIIIFYISGLYDLRRLRNNLEFLKTLWLTLSVNAVIAVFFFYLIPAFGITPKTNLFIFLVVFVLIEGYWRRLFNGTISSGEAPYRVLAIGQSETAREIYGFVKENPQLGYEIKEIIREEEVEADPQKLEKLAAHGKINMIIIPRHLKNNPKLTRELYGLLNKGVEIRDLANFYELTLRKVPLADLEESWFLENLIGQQRFYDQLKRAAEFFFALVLEIILLPLELLIATIIKMTSPGPIVYKQVRVGKNGKEFTLYKFRNMRVDAEKDGAKWAEENDGRVTPFGKFLRRTHLDEILQLINIIKGELSFVGPRPERPEFVKILKEQIPYYEVRLLVKQGVTGWAQINYRYGASVEDAYEKLQYEIYYIKNRSIILDLAIILKTARTIFVNQK